MLSGLSGRLFHGCATMNEKKYFLTCDLESLMHLVIALYFARTSALADSFLQQGCRQATYTSADQWS